MNTKASSLPVIILLTLLLWSCFPVPALAQEPASQAVAAESGAIADVEARLGELEQRLNELQADVDGIVAPGSTLPRLLSKRIALVRANSKLAIGRLAGQPGQKVLPLLDRYQQLVRRLDRLETPPEHRPRADGLSSFNRTLQTGTGSISGFVIDDATGLPLSGVKVQAGSAYTNTNGEGKYLLTGLTPGTNWTVHALPSLPYAHEVYREVRCTDLYCEGLGTPVTVAANSLTGGINFSLVKYGSITGRVVDLQSGLGIPDVELTAYKGSRSVWVRTDSTGGYSLPRLIPGTYKLVAEHSLYVDELYLDIPFENGSDRSSGTDVVVESGSQLTIDLDLTVAGSISGLVTEAATGNAVSGTVYLLNGQGYAIESRPIDSNGRYTLTGLNEGDYYVQVEPSGPFQTQLYSGIVCQFACDLAAGILVHAAPGSRTEGIDFSLSRLGAVEGRVIDAADLSPLVGCMVHLFTAESGQYVLSSEMTDANGEYQMGSVFPDDYYVRVHSSTHLDEVYDDLPNEDGSTMVGTPVPVLLGNTTSDIDFALNRGGGIRGTVRAAADQALLRYFDVTVYDDQGRVVGSAETDVLGVYFIGDLATGDYRLEASESYSDYLSAMSGGVDCEGGCNIEFAAPVSVTAGQITEPVDFNLKKLPKISGTVLSAKDGGLVEDGRVSIVRADGSLAAQHSTGTGGSYSLTVQPGVYWVVASGMAFNRSLHTGALCTLSCERRAEDGLAVAAESVTEINFQLHPYAHVSGRVVDAVAGNGIAQVTVFGDGTGSASSSSVRSDDSGYYTLWLPVGSFGFRAQSPGTPYSGEVYPERSCSNCYIRNEERIEIGTEDVNGINFTLDKMGRIAGRVIDQGVGSGLLQASVAVYDNTGSYCCGGSTASSGDYTIQVPKGVYFLAASAPSYISEIYDNLAVHSSRQVTDGTAVTVITNQTSYGFNFALAQLTFADVSYSYWARPWIDAVFQAGITAGCSSDPPGFCPEEVVKREQLAVFLLKAIEGATYQPPAAVGQFADVPASSPFAPWVEEVSRRGLTAGCAPNQFCPSAPVTREQAAVFLLKAIEAPGFVPPPATGQFDDVPTASPFAPWVEELARRGITAGCSSSPPGFCPAIELTRAQMAVFLAKAFGLTVGGF